MYHTVIIGNRERAMQIAKKLLNKLSTLSISVVEPYCKDPVKMRPDLQIPHQVTILPECTSTIFIKRDCLQLENQDYLYFDFLILDPEAIDSINFS